MGRIRALPPVWSSALRRLGAFRTHCHVNAELRTKTPEGCGGGVKLRPGPWAGKLLADLGLPLKVERQVQFWFEPKGGLDPFLPDRFPIWNWETKDGAHPCRLPATDGPEAGVKVSIHHGGQHSICTPDTIDRVVTNKEVELARRCVSARLAALNGRCLNAATCMYTNTPDEHFLLDRHPLHRAF